MLYMIELATCFNTGEVKAHRVLLRASLGEMPYNPAGPLFVKGDYCRASTVGGILAADIPVHAGIH